MDMLCRKALRSKAASGRSRWTTKLSDHGRFYKTTPQGGLVEVEDVWLIFSYWVCGNDVQGLANDLRLWLEVIFDLDPWSFFYEMCLHE